MPATATLRLRPPSGATAARVALVAWLVLTVVCCMSTARKIVEHPDQPRANRTEEFASRQWWSQGDLYRPFDVPYFLYLPHAAILYTPFHAGPDVLRNVVVRVVYAALLVGALWVFAGLGDLRRRGLRFLLMSVVCIPVTGDSIRAAQANLPLAACMLFGTVAIARGHWARAAILLLLGIAFKPLGIVWLLLAAGMWPRPMIPRVTLGLGVLLLVPFAFGPPGYVLRQYADFAHTMTVESDPTRFYSDIRGFLTWGIGVRLPPAAYLLIRASAALATLVVAVVACRRRDRAGAALVLYVLAATYLMLFNPKTEGPTFALLGPAIGVVLAWAVLGARSLPLSLLVASIAYLIALCWEIWGPKNYWFQPTMTMLFLLVVLITLFVRRPTHGGPPWRTGEAAPAA